MKGSEKSRQSLLDDDMNAMDVALICKALGDSNRLEIVQMLSDG